MQKLIEEVSELECGNDFWKRNDNRSSRLIA